MVESHKSKGCDGAHHLAPLKGADGCAASGIFYRDFWMLRVAAGCGGMRRMVHLLVASQNPSGSPPRLSHLLNADDASVEKAVHRLE